jgi:hypothetical protein
MREGQIALHPGHHSRLHKLVEYIILAAERRRSVTISAASRSSRYDHQLGRWLAGGMARRQIRNFKFQISNFKNRNFKNRNRNFKFQKSTQ